MLAMSLRRLMFWRSQAMQFLYLGTRTWPLIVKEKGHRSTQAMEVLHPSGLVDASADMLLEIQPRIRLARACFKRFKRKMYDTETAPFKLKVRLQTAEQSNEDAAVRVSSVSSGPEKLVAEPPIGHHERGGVRYRVFSRLPLGAPLVSRGHPQVPMVAPTGDRDLPT